MPIKEIFVFRHGETNWNKERRYQGHSDVPLNEEGRRQAEGLRSRLEKFTPQVILSSDLSRAFETAKIAAANLNVDILPFAAFRECHLGECEGLHKDVINSKYGDDQLERWGSIHRKDHDFRFPGGESKHELLQRMQKGLMDFCSKNPKFQSLGLATHGGSLRTLIHSCSGAPKEAVALHNCVLYKISLDILKGEWKFIDGPL